MRVLVTSPGLLGHVHPMMPLASAMVARGHDVLWAVPREGLGHVERKGFRAVAAGASELGPAAVLRRYPELRDLPLAQAPEAMFAKLWGAMAAPMMLTDLVPVALEWRPDLVVADAAEFAGHIVAAELGVPSVTKGFGPLLPERRVAAASAEVAPLWWSRGLEPRPYGGSYEHLYLDIYPPELQPQNADHVPHRQRMRPIVEDGGVGTGSPPSLPQAPSDAPLVYVTMGTVFNNPQTLKLVTAAAGELHVRVLVTVGPKADTTMLGTTPARVRIERYVPQTLVLPHCNLVVSHGGSGTMLAALTHGLPQLCLPQGADQFLNAAALASAGAGISLMPEETTTETVRDAAARLLGEAAFREAARRVSESIASMPPPDDVAASLEALAGGAR
jgi:UDP:flavonoid glycosyltransferase YjiC (YdhE family)